MPRKACFLFFPHAPFYVSFCNFAVLTPLSLRHPDSADGLWDVMTGQEAVEIAIAAHGKAPTTTGRAPSWANALVNGVGGGNAEADPANALVREAVKRGTSDNVTAVVTILSWD
ncbi:unnamed protein product [Ectocarpus sp. 8 AP-2014]